MLSCHAALNKYLVGSIKEMMNQGKRFARYKAVVSYLANRLSLMCTSPAYYHLTSASLTLIVGRSRNTFIHGNPSRC